MKQRITTLFASGVLALALFGVARAGPFEDAQEADQKGDYATELQILRPLAEQGNALAQLGSALERHYAGVNRRAQFGPTSGA